MYQNEGVLRTYYLFGTSEFKMIVRTFLNSRQETNDGVYLHD